MSVTQSVHYGKAYRITVAANTTLKLSRGRVVMLNVTQPNLRVMLPDATTLPMNVGGPCFYLANVGTQIVTIVDQDDVAIGPGAGTIAVDNMGIVVLSENDDVGGAWHMKSTAIRGSGEPPPPTPTPTPTPSPPPTPSPSPPPPTPTPSPSFTTITPFCLVYGTMVTMADGSRKAIELLVEGDVIQGMSVKDVVGDGMDESHPCEVTNIKHLRHPEQVILNGAARATLDHPYIAMRPDTGVWCIIEAKDLQVGYRVLRADANGGVAAVVLTSVERLAGDVQSVSLSIRGGDLHFADGFVVGTEDVWGQNVTGCPVAKGASVVVVGNGPSLLSAEFGERIDAFDEVVRFNRYTTTGFERHTGTKTTLWSTFGRKTLPQDHHSPRPDRIIYVQGESGGPSYQAKSLYRIPMAYFLRKQAEIHRGSKCEKTESIMPSSGFLVISWLLDSGVDHLTIVGFDHFKKDRSGQHHYWNQRSFKRPNEHDGDYEAEAIQQLVAAGRITRLDDDLSFRREIERHKYVQLRQQRPSYGSSCHGRRALNLVMGWNPRSLIDFGCGGNEFVGMVHERGGQGRGVDFANERADVIAPMHATGLPDSSADVVTAFDSLEHVLPEDVEAVLREMRRVGKPGGRFVFSISTVPSRITVNGQNLHPTVQSIAWWLNRIRRHGTAHLQRGYIVGQWSNWK